MNIAFFLTPKKDVVYLKTTNTLLEALEIMDKCRFTAVPLINDKGKYVGTLTEGDLLYRFKKDKTASLLDMKDISLQDVQRYKSNKPVSINSDIEGLITLAKYQNFIPVVDDNSTFIGIIKRSDIISYCYERIFNENKYKTSPHYQILENVANN